MTSNYTYDQDYELTQVTQAANTTESYSYDPVGNRLSSLSVSSYDNNTSNELTSTPSASYRYDNNGNTTSKTDSTGTTNYAWDFENRLTSVTLPDPGGTVHLQVRSVRSDESTSRLLRAPASTPMMATTSSKRRTAAERIVSRYTQGENIDEPLADATKSQHELLLWADGLGSVTSLIEWCGNVAQTYTYDSFGKQTHSTGSLVKSVPVHGP